MHTASSPDEARFISLRIRIHQATNPNAFFVAYIIPTLNFQFSNFEVFNLIHYLRN